jgi:hypothetical protein
MQNFINPLDRNFSYGYDGGLYNLRSSPVSKFECHYQQAQRQPESFREECLRVCEQISDYAQQESRIPVILFSGGLDSEIVIRAFIDSGRPFRVAVNRFAGDLNSHELYYAERFLTEQGLTAEYLDIDIAAWLDSEESLAMAALSHCPYSEMLPTMKLIEHVYSNMQGVPVLGNGDFYARIVDDQWQYVEFEYILAWMRYCVAREIPGAINFFQQTPEIVLAMAKDPLIMRTIKEGIEPNLRSTKYEIYKQHWPDIEIRIKFNGAEKIQDLCDRVNQQHLVKYAAYTDKWLMPLGKFLLTMSPDYLETAQDGF